jgi:hypothetical protein
MRNQDRAAWTTSRADRGFAATISRGSRHAPHFATEGAKGGTEGNRALRVTSASKRRAPRCAVPTRYLVRQARLARLTRIAGVASAPNAMADDFVRLCALPRLMFPVPVDLLASPTIPTPSHSSANQEPLVADARLRKRYLLGRVSQASLPLRSLRQHWPCYADEGSCYADEGGYPVLVSAHAGRPMLAWSAHRAKS